MQPADIWSYLKICKKPILLYGMGNGADLIINRLAADEVKISGVFASDDFIRGQRFRGFEVTNYEAAEKRFGSFIILTAFGTADKKVIDNIKRLSQLQELYIPDVPVYGNTVFDAGYCKSNRESLDSISKSFADKRSAEVFDAVVNFKITADAGFLFAAEDDETESINAIVKLDSKAVIYDLGAYTGDTAEKFAVLFPDFGKMVAVEPDGKNFQRLKNCGIRNTLFVNKAISYLDGTMRFEGGGGRNQSLNRGRHTVACTTIDTLSKHFGPPDFIKFDIEGQEMNGIIGGEDTIRSFKPALMISAYHRSEDIAAIPKKVLSLNKEYKMYMRHFPCVPCWDTYYFFV